MSRRAIPIRKEPRPAPSVAAVTVQEIANRLQQPVHRVRYALDGMRVLPVAPVDADQPKRYAASTIKLVQERLARIDRKRINAQALRAFKANLDREGAES